jgi:predicted dehydrogenase
MVIAAAARQPKVILCEKPMATSLGEADEMIVACKRNGVKLAIGHQRRFYTGWEEAKRLIQDGAIGEPQRLWSVGQ